MESSYLQPEDIKKYGEFCTHHFIELVKRRKFSPLYHYTNGQSLISIIESGQLWATQIGCLNDAKELIHAVDIFRESVIEREKSVTDKNLKLAFSKIRELISKPTPEIAGAFIICFSERKDDLSQWRAYGGSDGGYAIEFDCEALLKAAGENNSYLVPVTYDNDYKNFLMSEIMKYTEIFFFEGVENQRAPTIEGWINEFVPYWLNQLSYLVDCEEARTCLTQFRFCRIWRGGICKITVFSACFSCD